MPYDGDINLSGRVSDAFNLVLGVTNRSPLHSKVLNLHKINGHLHKYASLHTFSGGSRSPQRPPSLDPTLGIHFQTTFVYSPRILV